MKTPIVVKKLIVLTLAAMLMMPTSARSNDQTGAIVAGAIILGIVGIAAANADRNRGRHHNDYSHSQHRYRDYSHSQHRYRDHSPPPRLIYRDRHYYEHHRHHHHNWR